MRKEKEVAVETDSSEEEISSGRDEEIFRMPKWSKVCVRAENAEVEVSISELTLKFIVPKNERITGTTLLEWITKDG